MKKKPIFITARAIAAALFLITSIILIMLALNLNVLDSRDPGTKNIFQLLAGPERYGQLAQKLSNSRPAPINVAAPIAGPLIPVAPPDAGPKPGFENFEAPGTIVNVTSTSQGPAAATVEYIGHDAGEPSIGVNWQSIQDSVKGMTAYQSDLQTDFVKFDDTCPLSGLKATWYNSQAPSSQFIDSDPIGFVDPLTGRVFCGQLTLTSPGCKISFTDTDGKDPIGNPGPTGWVGTTGPAGSGIDHETIGGGPYHLINGIAPPHSPTYANAVYYCSQDLGPAFCFRSDNGGSTFPVGPLLLNVSACGGLHGHIKVTPDTPQTQASGQAGTVYVPNNNCGGQGGVVVSEDNGLTWTARTVHTATDTTVANPNLQDPAVSIDKSGRIYFVMSSKNGPDSQAVVATSADKGVTWTNLYDVGAAFGIKNAAFPAAVAGDAGRAAVAFYGSSVGGDESGHDFKGIWHLYVAYTFDSGAHWSTVDATPNAPLQRGCIWMHGGVDICRNLLDFFDMTVDKQGRVQVGYVSGCVGGNCAQSPDNGTFHGNAYTATAVIARQSSGRRMLAAFDPVSPSVPGMPWVNERRVGPVVHLGWSEADDGNSSITSYQILRGTASNGEFLLTTVPGAQYSFDDYTANDTTKTYYYKVIAVNAIGSSCGNNEVAAPYVGDTCTGLIVQQTPAGHPEQPSHGVAPASLAIDSIAVGEPPGGANFLFKMKVTSLATVPPNSRWRMVWDSYLSSGQQFFVGMQTGSSGAPIFQFGEVMTGAIPPVIGLIGVPIETVMGTLTADPSCADPTKSCFSADGTIRIIVPKTGVGDPPLGYLLGAVNGRTFTADTPETINLERSTLLVDHTFVKAQRDNGSPAATYTVSGNNSCTIPTPIKAVSRKFHGPFPDPFNIDLLPPNAGIEMRRNTGTDTSGPNQGKDHQVVISFATPVTVTGVSITSKDGLATADPPIGSGTSAITVNLHNVTDAQLLGINLLGVSAGVGAGPGPVSIPMRVLAGDTNSDKRVNVGDTNQTASRSGQITDNTNFTSDVNLDGRINVGDTNFAAAHSGNSVP
jgi:hypothetical protein